MKIFNKEFISLALSWWQRLKKKRIFVHIAPGAGAVARAHGLDRRQFARIVLPKVNLGIFPVIEWEGQELPIVDISAGGACLYEEGSDLANMLSQELVLRIRWPERTDMVLSRIVGVSRNTHRHIQFLNLSAFTERQIKSLVQVGSIGQKISQVLPIKNSPVQLDVSELWTGVHGDGLIFFVNREISAELNMAGRRLRFFKGAKPSILDQSGSERTATFEEVADAVVCLANLRQPSLLVLNLIADLVEKK